MTIKEYLTERVLRLLIKIKDRANLKTKNV